MAKNMTVPGPTPTELEEILTVAARVPDHRRVTPFRFVVIEGDARARLGDVLGRVFEKNTAEVGTEKVEIERGRFLRAPVVIAVVSNVDVDHRTPEWEQILTVGAVCQNILIAANAKGFAAQWLTEWYAYDKEVQIAIGLSIGEKIAGFMYLGTATEEPLERPRPVVKNLVQRL